MSTLHFADAHLQKGAWAGRAVLGDAKYALTQVVDLAISQEVSGVFGAGDLFDKKYNRAEPISFFLTQLDRLREAGIPFFYIEGNHERDDPPWLSAHPWAQNLDKKIVELDGLRYYGLSFRPREDLLAELAQVPEDVDILICHQAWQDLIDISFQASFAEIPDRIVEMVTGDLHQSICGSFDRGEGRPPITVVSPGATCLQEIGEPDDKYVYLRGAKKWKALPLKTRPIERWPLIQTDEDMDRFVSRARTRIKDLVAAAVAAGLPEELQTPILRVRYAVGMEPRAKEIDKTVGLRAHLFVSAPKLTAVEGTLDLPEQEATVEAVFREQLADDPVALELMERLWKDPSPKAGFEQWKDEQLEKASEPAPT